ncbi:Structural maintenance of chromosomes protein 4 [Strongyloides ratti]|uniref:Structural maintenance of chromosomes protein n=1 Tax=Strongyloides ratti TaxID=34506 RepID=A0A090LLB0_STRRB|nr:Structural maintenance of chromosomes protein 4 [Strongyloides ratti]CEF68320.1 Structural maintenance of chromosomes protein 4 [Strongyloides ratti]
MSKRRKFDSISIQNMPESESNRDIADSSDFIEFDDDKENRNLDSIYNPNDKFIPCQEENNLTSQNLVSFDEYSALLDIKLDPKYDDEPSYSTTNEDRLIIDYIELENFKSYHGVNKMGPFGKNFSCIVGPNGSGKSNIFDCMLFVFDYNVKKFRTKKLSDLIHRSSNESCKFARVSIYFKRVGRVNEQLFDIEGSSFCVTRKITEDNKSSFYFNDRKISRNDLKAILKNHGLGLDHDRFLILQGEVESISLLKPKAEKEDEDCMLSLMDDIIGTSRYKLPLEKVNNGILELQSKVAIVNAKLRESEKFRNLLEENAKDNIEQNRIRNESKCEKQYDETNEKLCESKNMINMKNEEIFELENSLKLIEDERAEAKTEYKKCLKKDEEIKSSIVSNNMKLDEVRGKHSRLEEQLQSKERKNEILHQEIKKLETAPQEILKEKELNEKELNDVLKLEKDLSIKKENAEKIFEEERLRYASEYDLKQDAVIKLQNKIGGYRNEKEKLDFKLNQLASGKNAIAKEIENLENFIKDLNLSNKSSLEKKTTLLENINVAENELLNLKNSSKRYQADIKEHETMLANESEKFEAFKQKHNSFIDNENVLPLSETYKFLIGLNYAGFKGRLGDLASIDKKYDIALSTLGGRSLDMFVVETIKDGQYLMEQLRINRKGRAAFMCIEEVNKKCGDCSRKTANFEGAIRAFDLLENVPPEIRSCFYFVFRESLVVESLDSINYLKAKYGERIPKTVTLNGCIFETTGKITGGGKPISGLIGKKNFTHSKVDENLKLNIKEEFNKLSQKIGVLKMRNSQLLEEKHKIDMEIRKKVSFIEGLKKEIYFINESVKNGNQCLSVKQNNLNELKKELDNVTVDEDAYNKIVKEINLLEDKIVNAEKVLEEKMKEFMLVKNNVDILYTNLVEEHANNLSNCLTRKEQCQNSINQLQKKFNFSSKQYKVKISQQEVNENEIQELASKINHLQEKEEELLHLIDNLTKEKEENGNLLKTLNEKLSGQSDISRIKYQLIDLKNEVDQHQSLICTYNDKLKELKNKKTAYSEKIKNLKYIFYNNINLLPNELTEFRNDDLYYTKRVDESEKEFIKFLENSKNNKSIPMIEVPLKKFSDEEFEQILSKEEEIEEKLKIFESAYLNETSDDAVSKYLEKHEIYLGNLKNFNKISKIYEKLKEKSDNWRFERIKDFNKGFSRISKFVKEVYQSITFGGDADLEACDKFDPYNFGILYKVRPPGKSWKKMTNLSGGEKTLASLALVFALHEYNPTPLYIMDEIDAALDFRNVAIIGQYIKQRTLNAQFIVISLRKEMYELADKCVEIWKLNDKTRSACSDMVEIYEANKNCIDLNEINSNSTLKGNLQTLYELLDNA